MQYMKIFLFITLFLLSGCSLVVKNEATTGSTLKSQIDKIEFKSILMSVSNGWKSNDARLAANAFTLDAVYIEPPNQQLYQGRQEIFEFFGGESGRKNPMNMTWHHILFDQQNQIGTAEYTFEYKGRLSHGIVIIQISEGKIRRWREYQYRSHSQWDVFIGPSNF